MWKIIILAFAMGCLKLSYYSESQNSHLKVVRDYEDLPEKVIDAYRHGFQGQERDDEVKGTGNSVNFTFRMHDPRLGRFFTIDPLTSKYPHYTPYSFSGNKVIAFIELEGLEELSAITVNKESWTGTIDLSKSDNRSLRISIEELMGLKLGKNDVVTFDYQGGILADNSYIMTINVASEGQKDRTFILDVQRETVPVFEAKADATIGLQVGGKVNIAGEKVGFEANALNVELGEATLSQRYDSDAPINFEVDYIGKGHRVELSSSASVDVGLAGIGVEHTFEIDTRNGNDYGHKTSERYSLGPITIEEGGEVFNGKTRTSTTFEGFDFGVSGAFILGVSAGFKQGVEIITTETEKKNY